jgi:hypothetical protein
MSSPEQNAFRVRGRLLELHKGLLDAERREHEKTLGRLTDGEFLEALVKDPAFAWLHPLTRAITELDDVSPEGDWPARAKRIRALLGPQSPDREFARRYAALLQSDPVVLVAHGAVLRELG